MAGFKSNFLFELRISKYVCQWPRPRGQILAWLLFCKEYFLLIFENCIQCILIIPPTPHPNPTIPSLIIQLRIFFYFSSLSSPACIAQLLLAGGPALPCGQPARGHAIKENWLPLPATIKCKQLLSWAWNTVSTSPFLCRDSGWLERVHTVTNTVSSYMHWPWFSCVALCQHSWRGLTFSH